MESKQSRENLLTPEEVGTTLPARFSEKVGRESLVVLGENPDRFGIFHPLDLEGARFVEVSRFR